MLSSVATRRIIAGGDRARFSVDRINSCGLNDARIIITTGAARVAVEIFGVEIFGVEIFGVGSPARAPGRLHCGGEVPMEDRITRDPRVMLGKPCIRGTRLTVEILLEYLAVVGSVEGVVTVYPELSADDVRAAISYAAHAVGLEARAAG